MWNLLLIEMIAGLSPTVRSHTTYYYCYCPIQYSAVWQDVYKYLEILLDSSLSKCLVSVIRILAHNLPPQQSFHLGLPLRKIFLTVLVSTNLQSFLNNSVSYTVCINVQLSSIGL